MQAGSLGVSRYGQLGHGAFSPYVATPTPVAPGVAPSGPGATAALTPPPLYSAASCGTYFTLLVTESGQLLACGRNKYGCLSTWRAAGLASRV